MKIGEGFFYCFWGRKLLSTLLLGKETFKHTAFGEGIIEGRCFMSWKSFKRATFEERNCGGDVLCSDVIIAKHQISGKSNCKLGKVKNFLHPCKVGLFLLVYK